MDIVASLSEHTVVDKIIDSRSPFPGLKLSLTGLELSLILP